MILLYVLAIFPLLNYATFLDENEKYQVCFKIHFCLYNSEIPLFQIHGYKMYSENGL